MADNGLRFQIVASLLALADSLRQDGGTVDASRLADHFAAIAADLMTGQQ